MTAGSEVPPEAVEGGAVALAHEATFEAASERDREAAAVVLRAALEVCPVLGLSKEELNWLEGAASRAAEDTVVPGAVEHLQALALKLGQAEASHQQGGAR